MIELGRKYGQTMTVDEVKYNLEEFKDPVRDNPEFYDELKEKIIAKIKHVESEEVFEIETLDNQQNLDL
jgi:hypothetical protein